MAGNILEVRGLKTHFFTRAGVVPAVDGIDFDVPKGEVVGLVGESGCGKSVTAMSILKLLPERTSKISAEAIMFDGADISKYTEDGMRAVRGEKIAMIFQEPMTALNPVYTIGAQLTEMIRAHRKVGKREALEEAAGMLAKVGVPEPRLRLKDYPHQLSGGIRQRVMIAMALSCSPALLIADEPTTALDVTIQAQILRLITELRDRMNTAVMLITHDMGVVAETADDVMVMYAGQVVEHGLAADVFDDPSHPYTVGLLSSIPRLDVDIEELKSIEGTVPGLDEMPQGCRFADRCGRRLGKCASEPPPMARVGAKQVRCHLYQEGGAAQGGGPGAGGFAAATAGSGVGATAGSGVGAAAGAGRGCGL